MTTTLGSDRDATHAANNKRAQTIQTNNDHSARSSSVNLGTQQRQSLANDKQSHSRTNHYHTPAQSRSGANRRCSGSMRRCDTVLYCMHDHAMGRTIRLGCCPALGHDTAPRAHQLRRCQEAVPAPGRGFLPFHIPAADPFPARLLLIRVELRQPSDGGLHPTCVNETSNSPSGVEFASRPRKGGDTHIAIYRQ